MSLGSEKSCTPPPASESAWGLVLRPAVALQPRHQVPSQWMGSCFSNTIEALYALKPKPQTACRQLGTAGPAHESRLRLGALDEELRALAPAHKTATRLALGHSSALRPNGAHHPTRPSELRGSIGKNTVRLHILGTQRTKRLLEPYRASDSQMSVCTCVSPLPPR